MEPVFREPEPVEFSNIEPVEIRETTINENIETEEPPTGVTLTEILTSLAEVAIANLSDKPVAIATLSSNDKITKAVKVIRDFLEEQNGVQ